MKQVLHNLILIIRTKDIRVSQSTWLLSTPYPHTFATGIKTQDLELARFMPLSYIPSPTALFFIKNIIWFKVWLLQSFKKTKKQRDRYSVREILRSEIVLQLNHNIFNILLCKMQEMVTPVLSIFLIQILR